MRVIVTRPEHSGRRTAQQLAALGHQPVLLPLFAAVHDPRAASAALAAAHRAIALTSAEAVRCLAMLGAALDPHLDEPLFAVGAATAAAARAAGFRDCRVSAGAGIELAHLIAEHLPAGGARAAPLLYLAGLPRSPAFERQLIQLDIPFSTVECYRMEAIVRDAATLRGALIDTPPDAVLLYSPATAHAFFALPVLADDPAPLLKTHFFCLSHNIAEAIPDAWQGKAVIAERPDEESLLALLGRHPMTLN